MPDVLLRLFSIGFGKPYPRRFQLYGLSSKSPAMPRHVISFSVTNFAGKYCCHHPLPSRRTRDRIAPRIRRRNRLQTLCASAPDMRPIPATHGSGCSCGHIVLSPMHTDCIRWSHHQSQILFFVIAHKYLLLDRTNIQWRRLLTCLHASFLFWRKGPEPGIKVPVSTSSLSKSDPCRPGYAAVTVPWINSARADVASLCRDATGGRYEFDQFSIGESLRPDHLQIP
jgi:hypothetical protein